MYFFYIPIFNKKWCDIIANIKSKLWIKWRGCRYIYQ